MQLRYTKTCDLYKTTRVKQNNGVYIDNFSFEKSYVIINQELMDEISVSMYGADLNKMFRIKSIKGELEASLKPKMIHLQDNVSKYHIVMEGLLYRIKAVREAWLDIELIGEFENSMSI